MNTINKSVLLQADKLATLYAGELRGQGYSSESLKTGFNRFQFGFAEYGEIFTPPFGALLEFMGNFERKKDAKSAAEKTLGTVHGYINGKLARGWVVWRSIGPIKSHTIAPISTPLKRFYTQYMPTAGWWLKYRGEP